MAEIGAHLLQGAAGGFLKGQNSAGVGGDYIAESRIGGAGQFFGYSQGAINQLHVAVLQLPDTHHRNGVCHVSAADRRHGFSDLVAPFGNFGFVVDDFGKGRIGHVLHCHGVGAVDEILIGNQHVHRANPVKAVFGGMPIEIGERIEPTGGFGSVNYAISGGFFKANHTVLPPEFNQIGGFPLVVALQLVVAKVAGTQRIFPIREDFGNLVGGYAVGIGFLSQRADGLASRKNDVFLRLNVGAVDVGGEHIDRIHQRCHNVSAEGLPAFALGIPIAIKNTVPAKGRVGQKLVNQIVHPTTFPSVRRVFIQRLDAGPDGLRLQRGTCIGQIFIRIGNAHIVAGYRANEIIRNAANHVKNRLGKILPGSVPLFAAIVAFVSAYRFI